MMTNQIVNLFKKTQPQKYYFQIKKEASSILQTTHKENSQDNYKDKKKNKVKNIPI